MDIDFFQSKIKKLSISESSLYFVRKFILCKTQIYGSVSSVLYGGGGGIRTLEQVTPLLDFESSTFNHSATPPWMCIVATKMIFSRKNSYYSPQINYSTLSRSSRFTTDTIIPYFSKIWAISNIFAIYSQAESRYQEMAVPVSLCDFRLVNCVGGLRWISNQSLRASNASTSSALVCISRRRYQSAWNTPVSFSSYAFVNVVINRINIVSIFVFFDRFLVLIGAFWRV